MPTSITKRERLLRERAVYARERLIDHLVDFATQIAPAAEMMGGDAPEYVHLAAAVCNTPDGGDCETAALRFLEALVTSPAKSSRAA